MSSELSSVLREAASGSWGRSSLHAVAKQQFIAKHLFVLGENRLAGHKARVRRRNNFGHARSGHASSIGKAGEKLYSTQGQALSGIPESYCPSIGGGKLAGVPHYFPIAAS